MRSTLHRVLALVCFFSAAGLTAQVAPPPLRVLFLGNSLTDGNNVPALVQAMARLQGVDLQYDVRAPGGYAIEDHWTVGHQALLRQGNYDVLVLQQGPSTLVESQANLRLWTTTWATEAWRYGTQTALYMVWPVRTQTNGFALVSQSYRNAALAANSPVFPAGEAWEQVIAANPSTQLYSSDDLHATPAGSFLAAMVIARGLVSLDPTRVPNTVGGISLPANTVATFRTVVAALPATTLPSATGPDPSTPGTTPPTTTPPTTAPSTTGGNAGSGGGVLGGWFFIALLIVGAARMIVARRRG